MYRQIYDYAFSNIESYQVTDGINYNEHKPALVFVMEWLKNNPIRTVMDVGSGRGLVLRMIQRDFPSIGITAVDLNDYANLDFARFIKADLSLESDRGKLCSESCDLITCLDVLEHLEKELIDPVLQLFAGVSENAILSIANHSDKVGGLELHLIQEDDEYWTDMISKWFDVERLGFNPSKTLMLYKCRRKK